MDDPRRRIILLYPAPQAILVRFALTRHRQQFGRFVDDHQVVVGIQIVQCHHHLNA